MKHHSPWPIVVLILGIWFFAWLGDDVTRRYHDGYACAVWATIFVGFGYFIYRTDATK